MILFVILSLIGSCLIKLLCNNKNIILPHSLLLLLYGILIGILSLYIFDEDDKQNTIAWAHMDPYYILAIFVPPIIYNSASYIDYHILKNFFIQILFLTIPGVVLSTILIGSVIKLLNNDFTWKLSLLLGSVLSPTDPISIVNILKNLNMSKKLLILIEGESLFNDGTAYVMFSLLKYSIITSDLSTGYIITTSIQLTAGGILLGIVIGYLIGKIIKRVFNDSDVEITLNLISCYLTFYIAEFLLHVSGILAIVTHGLYISYIGKTSFSPNIKKSMKHVLSFVDFIVNNIIFVLSGAIISIKVNLYNIEPYYWGYLIILYILVNIIRFIVVFISYPVLKCGCYPISNKELFILSLSGLRGEITLILSLIIQTELVLHGNQNNLLLFYSAGIVCLTIIFNSIFVDKFIKKYIHNNTDLLDKEILHIEEHLQHINEMSITDLENDAFFEKADWNNIKAEYLVELEDNSSNNSTNISLCDIDTNINLRKEGKIIFLRCLKKQYWNMFDRHLIYKDVVIQLIELVDTVLDKDDLKWTNIIKPFCYITKNNRMYNILNYKFLHCLKKKIISYNIKHHYNIVSTFIKGHKEALDKLQDVVDDDTYEMLQKYILESQQMGTTFTNEVEARYPHLVREIETNQVKYLILKNQITYLKKLYVNGELTEKLHETFKTKIIKEKYNLHL